MNNISLGGNSIKTFSKINVGVTKLHNKHFHYEIISLNKNSKYKIKFNNYILINLSDPKSNVYLNSYKLYSNSFVTSGNTLTTLETKNNNSLFLIAGMSKKVRKKFLKIQKIDEAKKVSKPWGYEVWFLNKNIKLAFKKIVINKNFKTSLQYHKFKKELNFLFDGKIKFHYKKNNKKLNNIDTKDIGSKILKKYSSIFVKPKIIHRIEALSKITLYEVSTHQLKDVIRLKDDTNRPNGMIKNEHKN